MIKIKLNTYLSDKNKQWNFCLRKISLKSKQIKHNHSLQKQIQCTIHHICLEYGGDAVFWTKKQIFLDEELESQLTSYVNSFRKIALEKSGNFLNCFIRKI